MALHHQVQLQQDSGGPERVGDLASDPEERLAFLVARKEELKPPFQP